VDRERDYLFLSPSIYGVVLQVLDENRNVAWERPQMTTADRIRSMSDEQSTDFLCMRICFDCNVCAEKERLDKAGLDIGQCDNECDMHCFKWLQQPWEEE